MVAIIKTGSSLRRIVNYNEQKINAGVAECIWAANYPIDVELLTLNNKLNRLLNQAALNQNVTCNSVHISLNFDPSEQLNPDQLRAIAHAYMHQIGFGEQPYLVYQHFDAGHPHIHLVSVKVRADGSRIDMQNIGRIQSENARQEIEKTFGLVIASKSKKQEVSALKPINAQKVQYGHSPTKRAITSVLEAVLPYYKYASLPELNAVLGLYNVAADQGGEHSRVCQNQGLLYRILDAEGNRVGVPIKASDFYNKPTLAFLKEQFRQNESARQQHKGRVKTTIDTLLLKQPDHSLASFRKALEKEGVHTIQRKNADGILYGLTYVDHRTKCVFNGSDLGKTYTASGIQKRCAQTELSPSSLGVNLQEKVSANPLVAPPSEVPGTQEALVKPSQIQQHPTSIKPEKDHLLEALLQPRPASDFVPSEWKKNSKKKKKKRISD